MYVPYGIHELRRREKSGTLLTGRPVTPENVSVKSVVAHSSSHGFVQVLSGRKRSLQIFKS